MSKSRKKITSLVVAVMYALCILVAAPVQAYAYVPDTHAVAKYSKAQKAAQTTKALKALAKLPKSTTAAKAYDNAYEYTLLVSRYNDAANQVLRAKNMGVNYKGLKNYARLAIAKARINVLRAVIKTITPVIALINALPTTVTIANATQINAANTAFNDLTAAQQKLVPNKGLLTAAVTALAALSSSSVTSVSAINATTVTATLASAPATVPVAGDFSVSQAIDGAAATTITPTVVMDGAVATFTVPAVAKSDADQSVVYSVSYKGGVAKEATAFIVTAYTAADVANAISLINNSTVFNIVARLQTPVLNLQGIDATYAAEYQAARVANFTTTKAQIQSNVIDFVKAAADATLKTYIDPLNVAIASYKIAINETAQGNAVTAMNAAFIAPKFTGHFALIGYTNVNNTAYMVAFANAGILTTLGDVQAVITSVNAVVIAKANLTAAQGSVAALLNVGKTALVVGVDQVDVTAASVLVNALDNAVTEKAGLLVDVQTAQGFLDAAAAAVELGLAQAAVTALAAPVANQQVAIDAALVLVNGLNNAVSEKAGLLDDIATAQVLLDISTATAAVTALATPVAEQQVAIDAALVLVNGLDNSITEKAGLLVAIQVAQDALDAISLSDAQDAVARVRKARWPRRG